MLMKVINLFSTNRALKTDKFLALVKPPLGITKELTSQQKTKINDQITKKLQQLQDTGLSRQQILLSKSQKGIPLKLDPFFQFIKNNLKARQIYLKSNDRFSIENVVDIALRQDIGADPSTSRIRGPHSIQTKGRMELLNQFRDLRESKFNPQSYDGPSSFSIQKAYDQLKPHQPLRHYFKPLDRYEKRQQNLKQINKFDIHWRNIQLLRQFVTVNGNIKSRFKNYLSDRDQRLIRHAIKTSRIMGAMPHYGRTPQPLKRNITSLQDEVQQLGYQHINLETGHLFQTRSRSMDSLQVQIQSQNDLDYKYNQMTDKKKDYKIWVNNLDKQLNQQSVKAQRYARFLKAKQNQQKSTKSEVIKQNLNSFIKGISKYKALKGQDNVKIEPSEDTLAKKQYEQQKKQIIQGLKTNTNKVVDILLQDKLKL